MPNPKNNQTIVADRKGNGLLTVRQAHVPPAHTAHKLESTYSNAELGSALNSLGDKLNKVIAVLEAHGLSEDS